LLPTKYRSKSADFSDSTFQSAQQPTSQA